MPGDSALETREGGFSLVGLVVAVGVVTVLLAPLAGLLRASGDSYARGTCLIRLQEQARWVLERLERDLRESRIDPAFESAAGFSVGASSPTVSLNVRDPFDFDWDEGRIAWERNETIHYALEIDVGEIANDLDDDSDGLVDERRLQRVAVTGAGERRAIDLARDVPPESLVFERVDESTIRVSLTVTGRAERSELITASMSMDVYLRN